MTEQPPEDVPFGVLYGDFMIPRGNWGWIMSFKDDYSLASPDAFDSPARMRPAPAVFHIGETVKAARLQGSEYVTPTLAVHIHAGYIGTIVGQEDDRCYLIEFDDGKVVGFYHNEIDRIT